MDNIKNPKNITLHPCPICKTQMDVQIVELRKNLAEGEIDLEAITREWRHVCPKCDHETTKFIKTCHYCNTPDDVTSLKKNNMEKDPKKVYYHESCYKKTLIPYYILAFFSILALIAILIGIRYIIKNTGEQNVAVDLVTQAEKMVKSPFGDPKDKELFQQKRNEAKEMCKKSIKINKLYSKSYFVLGQLYCIDKEYKEALPVFIQGEKTAKYNNEIELVKKFQEQLDWLEKEKGLKAKW